MHFKFPWEMLAFLISSLCESISEFSSCPCSSPLSSSLAPVHDIAEALRWWGGCAADGRSRATGPNSFVPHRARLIEQNNHLLPSHCQISPNKTVMCLRFPVCTCIRAHQHTGAVSICITCRLKAALFLGTMGSIFIRTFILLNLL